MKTHEYFFAYIAGMLITIIVWLSAGVGFFFAPVIRGLIGGYQKFDKFCDEMSEDIENN